METHLELCSKSVIIAFEPLPGLLKWLDAHSVVDCIYQYYDFFIERSPQHLKRLFENRKHIFILASHEHANELETCISMFSSGLASNSQIIICKEKKSIVSSLQTICLKKSTRFTHALFGPNHKLSTRLAAFFGLLTICTVSLFNNSFRYLRDHLKSDGSRIWNPTHGL